MDLVDSHFLPIVLLRNFDTRPVSMLTGEKKLDAGSLFVLEVDGGVRKVENSLALTAAGQHTLFAGSAILALFQTIDKLHAEMRNGVIPKVQRELNISRRVFT